MIERLCRRGVITRVALVRAGIVAGMGEDGADAGSLVGTMTEIPRGQLAREKGLLERKADLRRREVLTIGMVLIELGFCSRQAVANALARQISDESPLGEIMVGSGSLTPEQLILALCEQEQRLEAMAVREAEGKRPDAEAEVDPFSVYEERAPRVEKDSKVKKKKKKNQRAERKRLGLPKWAMPAAAVGILSAAAPYAGFSFLANRPLTVPKPDASAASPIQRWLSAGGLTWKMKEEPLPTLTPVTTSAVAASASIKATVSVPVSGSAARGPSAWRAASIRH